MKKRLFCLLLTLLMVVCVFAGCGDNTSDPSATTTVAPVTDNTTPPPSTDVSGTTTEDPALSLDGYHFILSYGEFTGMQPEAGTSTADELEDIYASIEEKYNITIERIFGAPSHINSAAGSALIVAAVSGDKYADMIHSHQMNYLPLRAMNGLRILNSPEMIEAGLDTTDGEVFNQFFTEILQFQGEQLAFDISGKYESFDFGHMFAFNKRLVSEVGYSADQIYQFVRDGEWTYDKMLEIAGKITKDVDGDGNTDIWGISLDCDGNEIYSNSAAPILINDDGTATVNLDDPAILDAMYFMSEVSGNTKYQEPVISVDGNPVTGRGGRRTNFYAGLGGFCGLYGGNFGNDTTGTMEDEFGVVPIPKGPNADHYMMNMVDTEGFIMLRTNSDYAKSIPIIKEIGRAFTSMDDYLAVVLDEFRGDEQALEMLTEYCLPNATMNYAKASNDLYQFFRKTVMHAVYTKELSPAAIAETYGAQLQSMLDAVFR